MHVSRRQFLRAAGAAALGGGLLGTEVFAAEKGRPNIIVILSDDHGYASVGCQGGVGVPTPNIDSIAENGVRCTSGYVTCPVCGPTRAGLLTGRYQQRFGFEDNDGPRPTAPANFGLPEGEKTMADYLKAEGYATCMIGKWHLGHRPECHPQERGFDEFFGFTDAAHSYINPGVGTAVPIVRGTEPVDEKEYLTDAFGREAVSFIERHKGEPFFLHLAFNAVHHPLDLPERFRNDFGEGEWTEKRRFAAMLRAMDENVGKVLAKVREAGLEENTLIFFLGDNGGYRLKGNFAPNAPLRGFKLHVYEGGVRVPFLLQWKGRLPAGNIYPKIVSSLDILPTAVTAAGGKPASNVEGVNLVPYLTVRKNEAPHDRVFWRWIDRYAARVGDWKLVMNGNGDVWTLMENDTGKEELFNLKDDIGETKDLAATHPEKLRELQTAYREWDSKNIPPRWFDGRRKPNAPR
jgi:arylsulfatase A-like enzyme